MRRLRPLFLVLFTLLLILPSVHAVSQYVGYTSGQAGAGTDGPTSVNYGIGLWLQSPLTGIMSSVSFTTSTSLPVRVLVSSITGTPASTSYGCSGGTCKANTAGQTVTLRDNEALSGLSANTFTTVSLAAPVAVTANNWYAVTFTASAGGGQPVLKLCSSSCPSSSIIDAEIDFGGTNPSISSTFSTITGDLAEVNVGATFETGSSPVSFVTQCYGNCGSPAVTLASTNSTHGTNWNLSITQFYAAQSNLNGFIVNVTVPVARAYTNGNGLTLGLYSVDSSCSNQPFSPSCPGFLQSSQSFTNPSKGNAVMILHFAISNGQWFGVSVSGNFQGLDLNDTNTNAHLLQVAGRTPNTITAYSDLGNRLTGFYGFVQGNTVTGTGPNPPGCGTVQCYLSSFVTALGGGILGGLAAFGILFGLLGGLVLYATRQHDSNGHIVGYAVPMEFLLVIAVLLLIGLSVAGVLPPYIPLIVIGLVAWMFTSAIWGGRHKNTTGA